MNASHKQILLVALLFVGLAGMYLIAKHTGHSCTGCHHSHQNKTERHRLLLDAHGKPTATLNELLTLMEIQHDGNLSSIVEQTQKHWLRAPGKERWEMNETAPEKRAQALKLIDGLGGIGHIAPTQEKYTYACVLGALLPRVRTRIQYLIDIWKDGVRFDQVVVFGGERPLDEKLESRDKLLDLSNGTLRSKTNWQLQGALPTTETTMMQLVYDQADLPTDLAAIPVTFVNAPMVKKEDGSLRRPSTSDTFTTWLAEKPTPGTCLFISNNPYIGYQDSVARSYLSDRFSVETAGPEAYADLQLSVHLDNIARWLYQEKVRREQKTT